MFYSHQLLARKAPLGQIWMAATMHAKINRRKLDKLNIIKICEEILNPSIPMALRLSGILMGGVVIVYERKVKLLYEDVTRLMVEINEAWKVKTAPDQKVLPKRKTQAKKEAITKSENEEMTLGDIEQSLQFSNTAATTMGIQHGAYFNMRLDNVIVDEVYINNEDPTEHLHQADPESITLVEPYQATADPYNDHFERFDIEGDDETQVNVPSLDDTQIPTMPIHSPPHREDPKEDDIMEDQHPGDPINHQTNVVMEARQEPRGRGPTKRKRGQPREITMDYEHTMIPAPLYQDWLQDASDIVSRRGRKKKPTHILSSKKIANLMKMPPVVLNCNLYTSENKDIYYPAPLLDLWVKSNQPPHNSPSAGVSAHHPPEPSSSSPPGGHDGDFTGFHVEDFDPPEMLRNNNQNTEDFMDELRANLNLEHGLKVPEAALPVSSQKSGGDNVRSSPIPLSEHGLSSHSDLTIGRISNRFTKKRLSSSRNSSGGLQPVDENEAIKLADSPTRDQEPLVETGPTQTQANINHPSDKITNSIHAQMKAHFETPGVPQVESLDLLAAGMTRRSAAQLFYQTLVLASRDVLKVEQKVPYGEILISRGSKM